MTALTEDGKVWERQGRRRTIGAAAAVTIYEGALLVQAAGYATPATTAVSLVVLGVAESRVDNAGGAAGDKTVEVLSGIFGFKNSAGADEVLASHIGSDCYIVDDQTVSIVATGKSIAGKVWDVDADFVYVAVGKV